MEARLLRAAMLAALLIVSMGARFSTPNFLVETRDPRLAKQFAEAAETHRKQWAVRWLGRPMPNWSKPCVITVQVGPHLEACGATSFIFHHGEVYGWRMTIQGSAERIVDSVLPHEITHMIFASHFRQPLPRWADEGGATSVEHVSERAKHRKMLIEFLQNRRGIAFDEMFAMMEYPPDYMPLYAQGYSLAEFLIQRGGRRKYVEFLGDGLKTNDWAGAVRRHYDIDGTGALQNTWLAWVRQGSPVLCPQQESPATAPAEEVLAATDRRQRPEPNLIYRIPREQLAAYAPGSVIPAGGGRPSGSAVLALVRPSERPMAAPVELPPAGWYAAGTEPPPAPSTMSPAVRSQLTRPQPIEQPQPTPPNRIPISR